MVNKYKDVSFSLDDGTFEDSPLYAKQREERGWDDTEVWNLDYSISSFILPRLKVFRKIHHGHPSNLSENEWEEYLDKMILAFELNLSYEDLASDDLEEKESEIKEGLALFAEYFNQLWD